MSEIREELTKLKNNIQNYTLQKVQPVEQDAKKYMEKIKKRYNDSTEVTKEKLLKQYNETIESYNATTEVLEEKRKAAYKNFVNKLEKLNEAIEKATHKRK